MKISQILNQQGKAFPSLEIVPPLKGITKSELLDSIRPFMEFDPPYINVTSHREEIEYTEQPDGTWTRRMVRRRVSESAVCGAVQAEFKVETVPHLICGGATKDHIESLLEDFRFMGIGNILALRGDCLVGEKRFTPVKGGYCYASELVKGIRDFEKGTDTAPDKAFCIGVGGYPEKHFEAANLETDIANLKKKVDAGADYIVTQMFFDNKVYYAFVEKCRKAGITVPIIPGLKPISTAKQLSNLPEAFSLDIPVELSSEITKHADNKEACYQIGQEWCQAQCRDLLASGCRSVHFYTMGRTENIVSILRNCF